MEVFQEAHVSLRSVGQRGAYVHAMDDGRSVRLDGAYAHTAVWAVQRHYSGGGADGDGTLYVLLRSVYGRYLGAPEVPVLCGFLPTWSCAATQRELDETETKTIMWRAEATGIPNTVLLHDESGRYLRANQASCFLCRAGVSVSTRGCLGTPMQWEVEAVPQLAFSARLDLSIPSQTVQSEWARLLAWVCLLLPGVIAQRFMSWRIRWVRAIGSGSASVPAGAATGSQAHSPSPSFFAWSRWTSWFSWSA